MYHAHVKNFSRGKGESSIAAAAYRAGLDLTDTHAKTVHRYSHRAGVVMHRMLAPSGAPAWVFEPEAFWDINEAGETRHNARVARELEVSLPAELDPTRREDLALGLGQLLVDRYQCAVLVAVHLPSRSGDQRNHHTHLLMSARQITPIGLGERAGAALDARGGQGAVELRALREAVADTINAALRQAGVDKQVDHRSLLDQARAARATGDLARALGLQRAPSVHRGKIDTALERKHASECERRDEVAALIRQAQSEGRLMDTPDRHTLDAARRNRAVIAPPSLATAGPQHLLDQREFKAWFQWEMSPLATHLDRHFARVRAEGARRDDVLAMQAELVNAWLEAQRQAANEALQMLSRRVPEGGLHPDFETAVASVCLDRTAYHAATPNFFAKSEWLCRKVVDYVRVERGRLEVEEEKKAAWSRLIFARRDCAHPRDPELLNARRLYSIASERLDGQAVVRRSQTIEKALNEMLDATEMVENEFPLPRTNIFLPEASNTSTATEEAAPESAANGQEDTKSGGSGSSQELRPKLTPPRKRGFSGSMGWRS